MYVNPFVMGILGAVLAVETIFIALLVSLARRK